MPYRLCLGLGVLLAVSVWSGLGPSAAQSVREVLTAGVPIRREAVDAAVHQYELALEAGQFTVLGMKGTVRDLSVSVLDPTGHKIVESADGEVSVVAELPGRYVVEVRRAGDSPAAGAYVISADPPRPAGWMEKARASADVALSEGRALWAEGKATARREALDRYERALELFRESAHRPGQVIALLCIGDAQRRLGDPAQATLDYLHQAVDLARRIGDRSREALALVALGTSHSDLDERTTALTYLDEAVQIYETLGDRRGSADALTSKAVVFQALSEYEKAVETYHQALAAATAAPDRAREGTIHNNLGVTYRNLGSLPRALAHHREALLRARSSGNRNLEFMTIFNAGVVYKELGDYDRALESYRESLTRIRKLANVFREGQVLNSIGNVYRAQGDIRKAVEQYDLALAIFRRANAPENEAAVLNNMGAAYSELGDYERALEHHRLSREMRRAHGDPRGESSSLQREGIAWHKLGDTDRALELLNLARDLQREYNDPIREAETLLHLAAVHTDRGSLADSRTALESALRIIESLRANIADAGLRASYVARVQETYASYVDVLMRSHELAPAAGYEAAAFEAAERMRARVLLESLVEARNDIREGADPTMLEREHSLERKMEAASRRLSRALSGPSDSAAAAARDDLERLTAEYQEVQTRIRTSSPRYAALTQPEPLRAARIQREVIDEDTVLLEFALGETRSWLWAVTPERIQSVALPPRGQLEAAAREMYEALTARQPRPGEAAAVYTRRVGAADRDFREHAAAMGRLLLGGVAAELHGPWRGKRLVVVAGGALEYLPFGALPVPAEVDGHTSGGGRGTIPLIMRHEIVTVPSASVLATLRREAAERRAPRRAVAVLADPVFASSDPRIGRARRALANPPSASPAAERSGAAVDSTYPLSRAVDRLAAVRGGGLARLPFSREEANAIARLAGATGTLRATDFDARRTAVLGDALEEYRIVHFATHGLIDDERPELSGLVLSLVDDRGAPVDGLLRLHDIFNMRLNADLVVLSACQTALGKQIKGEGLVGLTRGFMYAGAPRVVASLWQVSDLATAELMKKFYAGMLRRNLTPAAALRAAQLEMIRDSRWAAPYFWAGFVLQGDWR